MFVYEKRLQYPVHIKNTNPRLAKMIISQYGGPHGEIGASLRYLSQRYSMPLPELKAILTDIGIEGSQKTFCPLELGEKRDIIHSERGFRRESPGDGFGERSLKKP